MGRGDERGDKKLADGSQVTEGFILKLPLVMVICVSKRGIGGAKALDNIVY